MKPWPVSVRTGRARASAVTFLYLLPNPAAAHDAFGDLGPFYASYCIFELDPSGQYAFVAGANKSYLWLLARTPRVDQRVWRRFENRAQELGFDTSELVRVEHGK